MYVKSIGHFLFVEITGAIFSYPIGKPRWVKKSALSVLVPLQWISHNCRMNNSILEILNKTIKKSDKRILVISHADNGIEHQAFMGKYFPNLEYNFAKSKAVVKDLPKLKFDVVYLDNVFQTLEWKQAKSLMKSLGNRLRFDSRAIITGPLKYNEQDTTLALNNESLEVSLKNLNPLFGIRSFESINNAMMNNGFQLLDDHEHQNANEYSLVYTRLKFEKQH